MWGADRGISWKTIRGVNGAIEMWNDCGGLGNLLEDVEDSEIWQRDDEEEQATILVICTLYKPVLKFLRFAAAHLS